MFKDDIRTGYGTMYWPNGTRFDGDWVNDERTGHGTILHTNGDLFDGEFHRYR